MFFSGLIRTKTGRQPQAAGARWRERAAATPTLIAGGAVHKSAPLHLTDGWP